MPVGPSQGASGHDAVAFHVFTSMTWIVFFDSLLTKMWPLAVGGRAFGGRVFQFDRGHDVATLGIDRRQRADRPAVIGEDDLVVGLVIHDAVEARADLDLPEHRCLLMRASVMNGER